jgi:ubiquinone/menaquinone biosynthesis C-methylase UbiE
MKQDNEAQAIHRQAEIEKVLRMHPGVREAAVVHDGRDGFAAFVVPDDLYMDDVAGRRAEGSTILGKWQKTFDLSQLTKEAAAAPVGFNTIGWNSSYTRQPIPVKEIREWVEATVEDILQLAPKAVYEIGCGTGMLLMRIAPRCDRYVAVDFSSVVLNRLREQLRAVPSVAERVEVMERRADNFDGLAENSFDAVVLNSVAQYFPDAAYLTRVLEGAVRIAKPGGHVYVGDSRSLPLLPAFASSIELFQAGDEMSSSELRDRIRRRIEREKELVLSPTYFLSLRHRFPKISRVEIRPLRGRSDNEMSRYRYETILHVGHETRASQEDAFPEWSERGSSLDDIRSMLRQDPNKRNGINRIRNTRIEKDLAALAILRDAETALTAGELRHNLEQNVVEGIHPQALMDLEAEGLGFKVFLSWAACRSDGSYDACFVPAGWLQEMTCPAIGWPEPDASEYVRLSNAPGQRKLRSELINQLVAHCNQSLPQETVPREITLVDTLARTSDGIIDPKTLLTSLPML